MEEKKKAILQETDLLELASKLLINRKLFIRNFIVSALIGIVVAFSIPKEYTAQVVLAPEIVGESSLGGSLGSLASMAGINLNAAANTDALYPELYPQIVGSAPFVVELFPVRVKSKDGEINTNLYDYLYNHQKIPWWGYITKMFKKGIIAIVSLIVSADEAGEKGDVVNPFNLSRKQRSVAEAIKNSISVFVDKKNQLITLSVTAQDPLICATLTDTVKVKLQDAVTEYRTKKARNDLEFAEKMYAEAQQEYFEAQKNYAIYSDKNQSVVMARFLTESERLKNEMDLAFSVYNQMAQQLQVAKIKVQERTPIFTEVDPATVPMLGSGLPKLVILFLWIFLGLAGTGAWVLGKPVVVSWIRKIKDYGQGE